MWSVVIFFFKYVSRSRIVNSCFIETRILASIFLTFCANQSLIFQLFLSPLEVIMVTGVVEWFLWTRNHVKASYVVAHLIHTTTLWSSCYLLVSFLQKCQTICLKSQSLQVGEPRQKSRLSGSGSPTPNHHTSLKIAAFPVATWLSS